MDCENRPTILNFPSLQAAKNAEEFENIFTDEICDHHYDLPLDRFCVNGGAGEDVEDESVEVKKFTELEVTGVYHFSFVESYHGGCRDINHSQRYTGELEFVFNRDTHKLRLSGGTAKREYDPEEF